MKRVVMPPHERTQVCRLFSRYADILLLFAPGATSPACEQPGENPRRPVCGPFLWGQLQISHSYSNGKACHLSQPWHCSGICGSTRLLPRRTRTHGALGLPGIAAQSDGSPPFNRVTSQTNDPGIGARANTFVRRASYAVWASPSPAES